MQEITKIVVPLDLERHTLKLVDFALYIAEKLGTLPVPADEPLQVV